MSKENGQISTNHVIEKNKNYKQRKRKKKNQSKNVNKIQ